MEKFFDIATPEEIAKQFPTASKRPEWLEHTRASMDKHPDYNCEYLVYLYWGRGDRKKAEYYLDQIKDERRQLDVSMLLYECREP